MKRPRTVSLEKREALVIYGLLEDCPWEGLVDADFAREAQSLLTKISPLLDAPQYRKLLKRISKTREGSRA